MLMSMHFFQLILYNMNIIDCSINIENPSNDNLIQSNSLSPVENSHIKIKYSDLILNFINTTLEHHDALITVEKISRDRSDRTLTTFIKFEPNDDYYEKNLEEILKNILKIYIESTKYDNLFYLIQGKEIDDLYNLCKLNYEIKKESSIDDDSLSVENSIITKINGENLIAGHLLTENKITIIENFCEKPLDYSILYMNLKKQILSDNSKKNHYFCLHLNFERQELKELFLKKCKNYLLNYVHRRINYYNIQQYEINNFYKSFAGIETMPEFNYVHQEGSSNSHFGLSHCENPKNDVLYYNKISIFAKIQIFKNYKNKNFEKYFFLKNNERVKVVCFKFISETILGSNIFYFIQKQKILHFDKLLLGDKSLIILSDKIEPCYETGIVKKSDKKSEYEFDEIERILKLNKFEGTEISFCEQIFDYELFMILFN